MLQFDPNGIAVTAIANHSHLIHQWAKWDNVHRSRFTVSRQENRLQVTNPRRRTIGLAEVACPRNSGPMFVLELASFMELNYGQESQTRRDYCEATSC